MFLQLKDLFQIECRKCRSTNVDLYIDECSECGSNIEAKCNDCKNEYRYHDFKEKK